MIHYGDEGLAYCGREVVALTLIPWKVKCGNCLRHPALSTEREKWLALAQASVA